MRVGVCCGAEGRGPGAGVCCWRPPTCGGARADIPGVEVDGSGNCPHTPNLLLHTFWPPIIAPTPMSTPAHTLTPTHPAGGDQLLIPAHHRGLCAPHSDPHPPIRMHALRSHSALEPHPSGGDQLLLPAHHRGLCAPHRADGARGQDRWVLLLHCSESCSRSFGPDIMMLGGRGARARAVGAAVAALLQRLVHIHGQAAIASGGWGARTRPLSAPRRNCGGQNPRPSAHPPRVHFPWLRGTSVRCNPRIGHTRAHVLTLALTPKHTPFASVARTLPFCTHPHWPPSPPIQFTGVAHTLFVGANDKPRAGELINVLREAKQEVPEDLLKFGTAGERQDAVLRRVIGAAGPTCCGRRGKRCQRTCSWYGTSGGCL